MLQKYIFTIYYKFYIFISSLINKLIYIIIIIYLKINSLIILYSLQFNTSECYKPLAISIIFSRELVSTYEK